MGRRLRKKVVRSVPFNTPVPIDGTLYKKGSHGFIYYLFDSRWIRSSIDESVLAERMLKINKSRKKQGLGVEYAL